MGRRTAPWKAALFGAVCGTLPDLDVFIDRGDPIRNMTMHRTESHALFYLTLVSPALAWIVAKWARGSDRFMRWWLATWLALITHPLLDTMTVYGTQMGLPFTDYPFAIGSVFIIDPLYTIPLLVGTSVALGRQLVRPTAHGLRWNAAGLVLSSAYLLWSVLAQQHVTRIAQESLRAQGIEADRVLVGPTVFNTIAWRVLVMTPERYGEGFYSVRDSSDRITFDWFPNDTTLYRQWRTDWNVARIAWFSHGFFRMQRRDEQVTIADLRMGQEPYYTFTFVVGEQGRNDSTIIPVSPRLAGIRPDIGQTLRWLWLRMQGNPLAPPR